MALSALARTSGVEFTVAARPDVCAYAAELGFAVHRLELARAHRLAHAPRVAPGSLRVRLLARHLGSDVLYANGTRAIPYALGARALGGPPLLFHHHGVLTTGPVWALVRAVDRWADAIVVPSWESGRPFRRTDKVRLVANGVDLDHFRPPTERAGAKVMLGLPPSAFVVGTVTRPDPRKGMEAFCDLVERLTGDPLEARFLLVGGPVFPHEDEPYRRVVDRVRSRRLDVVVTGRMADTLLAYQAMDVFVHLGEPEGFGLAAVEAMACGVPVVTYAAGGVEEAVEGVALLVEPDDIAGAARAVVRLATDGTLRGKLAADGRVRCEERFGLQAMAGALGEVIGSLVGAHS